MKKTLLYKSLLESDFLLFKNISADKKTKIKKSFKINNISNLSILNSFEVIKSFKQLIRLLLLSRKSNFFNLIFVVGDKQMFLLLKEFFSTKTFLNVSIEIKDSFIFDLSIKTKKVPTFILNIEKNFSILKDYHLLNRLISNNIFLLYKINNLNENFSSSLYKMYNDILSLNKILVLIIFIEYFLLVSSHNK